MIRSKEKRFLMMLLMTASVLMCHAQMFGTADSMVLKRIFAYRSLHNPNVEGDSLNIYVRHRLQTLKKNKLLMAVPSMYALSRNDGTDFLGESYFKAKFKDVKDNKMVRQVTVGTVPRYRPAMPTMVEFLTPNLYSITLMKDHLLSPFHSKNSIYYRYGMVYLDSLKAELAFMPRIHNTQLVSGRSIVDCLTGRIIEVEFYGEYDMISFKVKAIMGEEGNRSLLPKRCYLESTFHCLGNRIKLTYDSEYGLPTTLADSIVENHDRKLMDQLRPFPLEKEEIRLYEIHDSLQAIYDSLPPKVKKRNMAKYVFWDLLGDNLVNRIKGNFGPNDQGYFRISPILNPLYFGYSGRKGLTYKFKLNGYYTFNEKQQLWAQIKGGYSFKQHLFYFNFPVSFTFNSKRNAYIYTEFGNGNRIFNGSVRDQILSEQQKDSSKLANSELDYFSDTHFLMRSNYDISNRWSIGLGFTYHRRSAVNKKDFELAGRPTKYRSFAPMISTQIRPWAQYGPVFTLNFEQGFNHIFGANMEYGRFEADASWQRKWTRLRTIALRLGGGVYTSKGHDAYFLDFENFSADNIPGGWNDDWTGDFQLLDNNAYNNSEYYIRANSTYESPMLLLSRMPGLGKYVEMERIYISSLVAKDHYPYMEYGYGFTNRLFSLGVFMATKNNHYAGFGFRVGFEWFRNW